MEIDHSRGAGHPLSTRDKFIAAVEASNSYPEISERMGGTLQPYSAYIAVCKLRREGLVDLGKGLKPPAKNQPSVRGKLISAGKMAKVAAGGTRNVVDRPLLKDNIISAVRAEWVSKSKPSMLNQVHLDVTARGITVSKATVAVVITELLKDGLLKQVGRRLYPVSETKRIAETKAIETDLQSTISERDKEIEFLRKKIDKIMPENLIGNMLTMLISRFPNKPELLEHLHHERTRIKGDLMILDTIDAMVKGEAPKHSDEHIAMIVTDTTSGWSRAVYGKVK